MLKKGYKVKCEECKKELSHKTFTDLGELMELHYLETKHQNYTKIETYDLGLKGYTPLPRELEMNKQFKGFYETSKEKKEES